jgi:hypothetical protein
MSQSSNEPNNSQGHPAWSEILDVIPESLHPLIQPKLEDWDKRQQAKLQEVHGSYEPYKRFVESKVDPQVIEQSLYLANHLQNNPKDFVQRAIANYELTDFVPASQVQQSQDNELDDEWDGDDITKHPAFKQVLDQLGQVQSTLQQSQQQQQEQTAQQQLEEYLDSLESEHGEFDRLYVASMLANNVDGVQAVKQYQDMVNSAALKLTGMTPEQLAQQQSQQQNQQAPLTSTPDAPVIMGASGNAGSGMPGQPVSMGQLSAGETQDLVLQMLAAAAKDE